MEEKSVTEKRKLKFFPWVEIVNRRFAKSFPGDYDLETLSLFHDEVDKELVTTSICSIKRNKALFSTLMGFYNHFCWKINWKENSPHMKSSCTKILSSLCKVGLTLSKGDVESDWLNKVLSALKVFPGDNDSLYGALLHITKLRKKYQSVYGIVLNHMLSSSQHRTDDPSAYFKLMFLYRRLKFLLKDPYERAEVISSASKVAAPLGTVPWLISNDLGELCGIKLKGMSQKFMNKAFSKAILEKLRGVILPDMCLEETIENCKDNGNIVHQFFIDNQPAASNAESHEEEIIVDDHTKTHLCEKKKKSKKLKVSEESKEVCELPDLQESLLPETSKRKSIINSNVPTNQNAAKKKKKIDLGNGLKEEKLSYSKQTLKKEKKMFAKNETTQIQEIDLSDNSQKIQSLGSSDFTSDINSYTPTNSCKKSKKKSKIDHDIIYQYDVDKSKNAQSSSRSAAYKVENSKLKKRKTLTSYEEFHSIESPSTSKGNGSFLVESIDSETEYADNNVSKKRTKLCMPKVSNTNIESFEKSSSSKENSSLFVEFIDNQNNLSCNMTPEHADNSVSKKSKKKRKRLSMSKDSNMKVENFVNDTTLEEDTSDGQLNVNKSPTTKRNSSIKKHLKGKKQESFVEERETSQKNCELENEDFDLEGDSEEKSNLSKKGHLKKEADHVNISVQSENEDPLESSYKVDKEPTAVKKSKRKRDQKIAADIYKNSSVDEQKIHLLAPRKCTKKKRSDILLGTELADTNPAPVATPIVNHNLAKETHSKSNNLVETDASNTEIISNAHSVSDTVKSNFEPVIMGTGMDCNDESITIELNTKLYIANSDSVAESYTVESISDSDAVESIAESDAVESIAESDAVESVAESDAVESIAESDAVESIAESEAVKSNAESDATESFTESHAIESVNKLDVVQCTFEEDTIKSNVESDAEESNAESSVVSGSDAVKSNTKSGTEESNTESDIEESNSKSDAEESNAEKSNFKSNEGFDVKSDIVESNISSVLSDSNVGETNMSYSFSSPISVANIECAVDNSLETFRVLANNDMTLAVKEQKETCESNTPLSETIDLIVDKSKCPLEKVKEGVPVQGDIIINPVKTVSELNFSFESSEMNEDEIHINQVVYDIIQDLVIKESGTEIINLPKECPSPQINTVFESVPNTVNSTNSEIEHIPEVVDRSSQVESVSDHIRDSTEFSVSDTNNISSEHNSEPIVSVPVGSEESIEVPNADVVNIPDNSCSAPLHSFSDEIQDSIKIINDDIKNMSSDDDSMQVDSLSDDNLDNTQNSIKVTCAEIQDNASNSQVNRHAVSTQVSVEVANVDGQDIQEVCNSAQGDSFSHGNQDCIVETDRDSKQIPSDFNSVPVVTISEDTLNSIEIIYTDNRDVSIEVIINSGNENTSEKYKASLMDPCELIHHSEAQADNSKTKLDSLGNGTSYEGHSSEPEVVNKSSVKTVDCSSPAETMSAKKSIEKITMIENEFDLKNVDVGIKDKPLLYSESSLNSIPEIIDCELENSLAVDGESGENMKNRNAGTIQQKEAECCKMLINEVREDNSAEDSEIEVLDELGEKYNSEGTSNSDIADDFMANICNKASSKENETVDSLLEDLHKKTLKKKEERTCPKIFEPEKSVAEILTENTVGYMMEKMIKKVVCVDNLAKDPSCQETKSIVKIDIHFTPEQSQLPKLGNLSNVKPFGFSGEESECLSFVDVLKENVECNSREIGSSSTRKNDFYPYRNLLAIEVQDDKSESNFSDAVPSEKLGESICVSDSDSDDEIKEIDNSISDSPVYNSTNLGEDITKNIWSQCITTDLSKPESCEDSELKQKYNEQTSSDIRTEISVTEQSGVAISEIATAETSGETVERFDRNSNEFISLVQTIQVPVVNLGKRCDDCSDKQQIENVSKDFIATSSSVERNVDKDVSDGFVSDGNTKESTEKPKAMENPLEKQSPTSITCNQESKDALPDNLASNNNVEPVSTRKLRTRNIPSTETKNPVTTTEKQLTPENSRRTRLRRKSPVQEAFQNTESDSASSSTSCSLRRSSKRLRKRDVNLILGSGFTELSLNSPKLQECIPTIRETGVSTEGIHADSNNSVVSLKVRKRVTRSTAISVANSNKDCPRLEEETDPVVEVENEEPIKENPAVSGHTTCSSASKHTKDLPPKANLGLTPINENGEEDKVKDSNNVESSSGNMKAMKRSTRRNVFLQLGSDSSKSNAEPNTSTAVEEHDVEVAEDCSQNVKPSKEKAAKRSTRSSVANEKGDSNAKLNPLTIDEEPDGEDVDAQSNISEESLKENASFVGVKSKAENEKSSTKAYNLRSKRIIIMPAKLNILKTDDNHS